ncbi:Uncharacterised protein [Amycolatopsis camponoti]|uniref:Uncharacterized protein n=1 Tax=Amycolatopsis camponoti TaxID=2606593 RepID=A0A6I8LJW7_9PSEU|nr:hypothetical protein [Amycolatopsis camponoti]VVJ17202.1 Uncharacterised protein [Amycolatopsis camponoti]
MSLEQVRAEAARDDYPAMARLARALYETGLGPREVLRECYGVEFPTEFFVLHDPDPVLLFHFTNQPANLAVPLDRGGPPPAANPMSKNERAVFARDPDLLPVVLCLNNYAGFGGKFLCYRLSELAAGRATVFAIEYHPTRESEITRVADSLLAALYEHHTAHLAWVEEEERATAGHSGGGTVDEEDLAVAQEYLVHIEDLRRQA